jgi:hypothetical protein
LVHFEPKKKTLAITVLAKFSEKLAKAPKQSPLPLDAFGVSILGAYGASNVAPSPLSKPWRRPRLYKICIASKTSACFGYNNNTKDMIRREKNFKVLIWACATATRSSPSLGRKQFCWDPKLLYSGCALVRNLTFYFHTWHGVC